MSITLHWIRPEAWWLLLPGLWLLLALWRWLPVSPWQRLIDPALLPPLLDSPAQTHRAWRFMALGAAWVLAVIALAGPAWDRQPQPVLQDRVPLVVLLDLDQTMLVQDVAPSRLLQARGKIEDLLLHRRDGLVGLIVYAAEAHVVSPLTDDYRTLLNLLPALDPSIMPRAGSQPAEGIGLALQLLDNTALAGGDLLLLTDGASPAALNALAQALQGRSETLHIIGIGTPQGGPVPSPRGGFLQDSSGQIVLHPLPVAALTAIAASVGGRYSELRLDTSDIAPLIDAARGSDWLRITERSGELWHDQGHWLILPLLPLLLLAFRRGAIIAAMLVVLIPDSFAQQPSGPESLWQRWLLTPDQRGQRADAAGDPTTAALRYQDPRRAGTAAYAAGDYPLAELFFSQGDAADDWFNRGNALAHQGRYDEAALAYREALQRDPGAEDAQHNLELVEALQEEDNADASGEDESAGENGDSADQNDAGGDEAGERDGAEGPEDDTSRGDGGDDAGMQPEGADAPAEGNADDADAQATPEQAHTGDPVGEPEGDAVETLSAEAISEAEREQALEQWLLRIPDDPGGLLRRKFEFESRQRQRDGARRP